MDDTEIFLAMVIEAIQSVMKGMLTHTQAELNCQLDMNRTTKGSHDEVLYNKHTVHFLSC